MTNIFNNVYDIQSISFEEIDDITITNLIIRGDENFSARKRSDSIRKILEGTNEKSIYATGYLNDTIPFILCRSNNGDFYLITDDFTLKTGPDYVIVDNKTKDFVENNIVRFQGLLEDFYTAKIPTNSVDKEVDPEEYRINELCEILILQRLKDTHDSLKDNIGQQDLTRTYNVFDQENLFFTHLWFDSGELFFAYESEESYKAGEKPVAISGDFYINSKTKRSINFIMKDNGQYERIKFDTSKQYIDTFEEYEQIMSSYGFQPFHASGLFKSIFNNGVPKPNVIDALIHYEKILELFNGNGNSLQAYQATINGIQLSVNQGAITYSSTRKI